MRRAMSVLMESWGVNVVEAEDCASALSLLEDLQITPDALLLDSSDRSLDEVVGLILGWCRERNLGGRA